MAVYFVSHCFYCNLLGENMQGQSVKQENLQQIRRSIMEIWKPYMEISIVLGLI